MLPLSRSNPLLPEFPHFMLDVLELVDYRAEFPKCVDAQNEQRPDAPAQNYKNWIIRFGKLEGPVLLGPMIVRGVTGLRRGAPPPLAK
jgi:hypothetical protein